MFDAKCIVAAAGESVVKVYDKVEGRHWECGGGNDAGNGGNGDEDGDAESGAAAVVERVRVKDGYLVEGRRDGGVGVWSV